ncbi:MAG TPA: DNA-3-methyladenine glycosylase [Myxococcota bacterium]|nr:DNA-3-methyladenine glycosylase [Myxococcota bacterium]
MKRSWFERDALELAPDLLGKKLVHGPVTLRITEVEAYRGPSDSAAHTAKGHTPRNAPMWGPGGHAYVYLCYGIHHMMNVVGGQGHACLVRSAEVVDGLEVVRQRRGGRSGPALLTGPGKVGQALGLDVSLSGHDLLAPGGLRIEDGPVTEDMLRGPRVGIDYAEPEHRDAPWRLALAGTAWVSHRKTLVSWDRC